VLALGHHFDYSIGWVVATVASIVLLLLPVPIADRAVLSLVVGPIVGLVVHGRVLARG
jgi:ribose/xylose/arabinose/galactoside ABC-type transport system permease subunit